MSNCKNNNGNKIDSKETFDVEIKKNIYKSNTWNAFSDFCGHTGIHGVQYLGEYCRHWLERVVWAAFLLSSFLVCCHFILNIWEKWNDTPVIVSFSEKSTPVFNIPFPAITICPQIKTRKTKFNYTDFTFKMRAGLVNSDHEKFKYFAALSLICDLDSSEGLELNTNQSYDVVATLDEMAPTREEVVYHLIAKQIKIEGNQISSFKKMITDSGICYTFNGISPDELYRHKVREIYDDDYKESMWTLENGYRLNKTNWDDIFPYNVMSSGINNGVDIYLFGRESDSDYFCRGPILGYNVIVHSPDELPQVAKQNFRVPFGKETCVNVEPEMITTSDGLKGYDPARRQCFFNSERKLAYFNFYSENNCEIECLANFTLSMCGCVQFWIPASPTTPVCNASKMECVKSAEQNIHALTYYSEIVSHVGLYEKKVGCNCLPACTSISYDTDISQADCNILEYMMTFYNNYDIIPNNSLKEFQFARIKVAFQEGHFLSSKRSELYGITDFIANCGGLLGLFMGISALSFVEIIYFCSFRLYANIHSPDELPQVAKQNFRVPFGKETCVNVEPEMITTSDGLKGYDPARRQCFFNSERKLAYFNFYSENNCEIGCLANFTLSMCGCVQFWIPASPTTPVCNASKMECVKSPEQNIHALTYYSEIVSHVGLYEKKVGCNCLPACTSISYDTDISQADCNILEYMMTFYNNYDIIPNNSLKEFQFARIKVAFQEGHFLSSKRSELYGITDFIANCGGLLGLFMGISALSFVEIIYFCSFRLYANSKLIKKNNL